MMLFDPIVRLFWEGGWSPGFLEPRRKLYDCELVHVEKGFYFLTLKGEERRISEGTFLIIPPGTWHESRADKKTEVWRQCVHFDWTPASGPPRAPLCVYTGEHYDHTLEHVVPEAILAHLPLILPSRDPELGELMDRALIRLRHGTGDAGLLLWPVLKSLLAAQRPVLPAPARTSSMGKPMRAVVAMKTYIDRNYAKPISYDDLCRVSGLTRSHMCNLFTSMIGRPPNTYLRDLRISHACALLEVAKLNVSQVATAVGIPDLNYFSRVFRKKFQVAPSEYALTIGRRKILGKNGGDGVAYLRLPGHRYS